MTTLETIVRTGLIGAGATVLTDVWSMLRKQVFGVAAPDFGLVGRWLGHMARGRFHHASIRASAPVRGERVLGWAAHYLTGIAFAALLVLFCGAPWLQQPSPVPALLVGACTVAAPFLLMQPGMGAGIFASRTPRPNVARLHSLVTHLVFGAGLYVSARMLNA